MDAALSGAVPIPMNLRWFLEEFPGVVSGALRDEFVGLYGYGSLVAGDFDPASSDLDLVVALAHDLTDGRLGLLRGLHADLAGRSNPWARRLEVWYMPVGVLRAHDPARRSRCACLSTVSPFGETEPDESWILNRHTVREHSPALAGPMPASLIDPIDPHTIRRTVGSMLRNSWSRQIHQPDWMRPRKYQAFTVLTMCRALHALEHGELLSKPRAADWALRTLDPSWGPLIRGALARRADPTPDDMTPTLEFVRFAVRQAASG